MKRVGLEGSATRPRGRMQITALDNEHKYVIWCQAYEYAVDTRAFRLMWRVLD